MSRSCWEPFGALDGLRMEAVFGQWSNPAGDGITAGRWLEHGEPIMRRWVENRSRCPVYRPPWPWLLWGDPVGWCSAEGERWLALVDGVAHYEGAVALGNAELAGYLAELRRVLAGGVAVSR